MMETRLDWHQATRMMRGQLLRAGIVMPPQEAQQIDVADSGGRALEQTDLRIATYANPTLGCFREVVLMPHISCRAAERAVPAATKRRPPT